MIEYVYLIYNKCKTRVCIDKEEWTLDWNEADGGREKNGGERSDGSGSDGTVTALQARKIPPHAAS